MMTSFQSTALFSSGKSRHAALPATLRLLFLIGILMFPVACVYVPLPDVGHKSGRAVISEKDMDTLKAGEGAITRKQILLILGDPNERYNRDEYFCYAWERMIGFWMIAGADPSGYGGFFAAGDTIGKVHFLCMQFNPDSRLAHIEHIESELFGDVEEDRKVVMRGWSKSASGDALKVTYDYYNLDRIRREVIQALAVDGFPEAQWRLYDEFGKKPDDRAWLCRSADSGYAKAQLEVGRIYWDNTGIPKHKIKAYVWYRLATSGDRLQENPADRETLVEADEAIREAVNTLDQGQLVEAYERYSEWEMGQCELELANLGLE